LQSFSGGEEMVVIGAKLRTEKAVQEERRRVIEVGSTARRKGRSMASRGTGKIEIEAFLW
jgi:hypothetical protein